MALIFLQKNKLMSKQTKRVKAYRNRKTVDKSGQADYINSRNNNTNNEESERVTTIISANDTGIGDAGVNRTKLTGFTSNHSADA